MQIKKLRRIEDKEKWCELILPHQKRKSYYRLKIKIKGFTSASIPYVLGLHRVKSAFKI